MNRTRIRPTTTFTPTPPKLIGDDDDVLASVLDQQIARGFRLWMLLAMILAILLIMLIMICCVVKIRIPRTKREIELGVRRRRKKLNRNETDNLRTFDPGERGCKIIVMTTGPSTERINLMPPGGDAESMSCTSCATTEPSRNHTPLNGSKDSLDQTSSQYQQHHLFTAAASYFQRPGEGTRMILTDRRQSAPGSNGETITYTAV